MSTEVPFRPLPLDLTEVVHLHGPDSVLRDGVAAGTLTTFRWDDSAAYPGTTRAVHVHVPATYDGAEPASLVVFLDGDYVADPEGEIRGGIVLDNLVHHGDLPATIGVFVEPGSRNLEYDAFDERHVGLLLDEILPEVARRWSVTDDPARRAIVGFSSGGNGAFTAAWLRPDAFGRVVCSLSSFAQMPGGNPYPALLAETPRKPVRVFLHLGHRDLGWDEPEDNWLVENLRTAAALVEATYDVRLVLGDGGHTPNHLGVLLPDALRWVFRPDEAVGTASP